MDPDTWAEKFFYDDEEFHGLDEYGFRYESEEDYFRSSFSHTYDEYLYESAENIGFVKKDREMIASLANILLVNGLRKEAPFYTGNLMLNGIRSNKLDSTNYDILILAPGQVDNQGTKLPDYGWQTDMLDRLQFYTVDGDFIDVPNKNKGWVQKSVYYTLTDLITILNKRGVKKQ